VQLRRALVAGQPAADEGAAARTVAFLVEDMRQRMRRVGIAGMQTERALDEPTAARPVAGFGAGEGMNIEEPPVVAVGRRHLVENAEQQLVSVTAAAEAGQAVDAGGQ